MAVDYLQKILTAKVYDVAVETPLELAPTLSERLDNRVWLKREDQQSVFSFKIHGDSYSDAYAKALELQHASGATFVHPYDDPDVIAGQGTIGMEILRQRQGSLDAIFVAIGGGGLIGGVAAYVKRVRPEVKIIGVQPTDSD